MHHEGATNRLGPDEPPGRKTIAHVVIVGAGPAGASLAYLLAHRGATVTLLERQHDFDREFRGEVLMPSGIAALEQMGLGEQLDGVPGHAQEAIELYMNGRLYLRRNLVRNGARADPRILAISQPALLEMLVAEAARSASFELRRGAVVTGLERDTGSGRVVGVRVRQDGRDDEIRGDLVIGADGRSSAVRRHAGREPHRTSPPMDIVWCKVERPENWTGARAYAGRGHLLIAYQAWDGGLQLGWVILKGTFGALRDRGIAEWMEEMELHVSPDFAEHLRAHRGDVTRPFLLSTASDFVVPWGLPGVLLIGDAAHTMSPVGAQGINIALRDAIVACNHLAPLVCEPAPAASALDTAGREIERQRMLEVHPIQKQQARPPKIILSRSWWGEPARVLAASALRRPALQRLAAGVTSAFLHGTTDVRLETHGTSSSTP